MATSIIGTTNCRYTNRYLLTTHNTDQHIMHGRPDSKLTSFTQTVATKRAKRFE